LLRSVVIRHIHSRWILRGHLSKKSGCFFENSNFKINYKRLSFNLFLYEQGILVLFCSYEIRISKRLARFYSRKNRGFGYKRA
jgi:hypothetical protein